MGRVNKKKLAEYTDSAENGGKKYSNEVEDTKKHADSDSADNDPLTNWNSKNESIEKKRTHSPDEAAPAESKKTAALPRKRKASAAASTSIEADIDSAGRRSDDGDIDDDDAPVNGKDVKKARKLNKGKVPAKVKGVAAGSANKGGKQVKKHSKAKETVLNTNNDDDDDEPSDEDEEYEVEKIVGFKVVQNDNYYQVRWKGYGKADDTWEPEDTLSCPELIAEFKQKVPSVAGKQAKKGGNKIINKPNTGRKSTAAGGNHAGKKSDSGVEQDPNKEWEVEKIVDAVEDSSGRLFRIRWKGFSAKNDTWEPENNLSCNDLIAKFTKRLDNLKNIEVKNLREDPKKTQRLVNETVPRTNYHNKIGRSSKRSVTKQRVFYGED